MVKNNNIIPNQHFHKQWQKRVKTWFNQAPSKKSRRLARKEKAQKSGTRPTAGALRPQVRCPTIKYNSRVRAGRGFTKAELKEAGVNPKEARQIGIAVDLRRRNTSVEGFQANVQRLKAYKARLVVFPRRRGKYKKGDSTKEELAQASQLQGPLMKVQNDKNAEDGMMNLAEVQALHNAYKTVRQARTDARLVGKREKAAREAEEAAKQKKKKKK
eukprot:g2208.t1